MNAVEYYKNIEVQFEMIKVLSGRETVFSGEREGINGISRVTFRCIKAHKIEFLQKNMKAFNFFNGYNKQNIYYSLARLNNMPVFSFNMDERKLQQKEFMQNFEKYMTGFDYGLDFDAHRVDASTNIVEHILIQNLLSDLKIVRDELSFYKVPFYVKSSGSGFHINIDSEYFDAIRLKNRIEAFGKISKNLRSVLNLTSVCDSSNTYNKRDIWKCPYSYDYKSGNIALPLSDEQIDNFDYSMLEPSKVLKDGIRNRGLLKHAGSSSGLKRFLLDYGLKESDFE